MGESSIKEVVGFGCTLAQGLAAIIYVANEMFQWRTAMRSQPMTPFILKRPKLLLLLLIGMTCTGVTGFWFVFHPQEQQQPSAAVEQTTKGNPLPGACPDLSQAESLPTRFRTAIPKRLTRAQEALVDKLATQYRARNPKLAGTPIELAAINKQLGMAGEPITLTFLTPIYRSPAMQSTGTGMGMLPSPDGTGIIGPKHTLRLTM